MDNKTDKSTIEYYNNNAEKVYDLYKDVSGGIADYFDIAFPEKSRIIDIGAGSGRDLLILLEKGHDAFGIEPSDVLRNITVRKNPCLCERLECGNIPGLINPFNMKFDGVVCSAVLMHVPFEFLDESIKAIKCILREKGRVLASIPVRRDDINEDNRDNFDRLYTKLSVDLLIQLFENNNFNLLNNWSNHDSLGRKGIEWATLLFENKI